MRWTFGITGLFFICLSQVSLASELVGWKVNERLLHPDCFTVRWLSSDNFEEYEDQFRIKNIKHFRKFPGGYFGREINNLQPIKPSWSDTEKITLIQRVEECAPRAFNYSSSEDQIYTRQKTEFGTFEQTYKILDSFEIERCSAMAPNIGAPCLASYRIRVGEYSGGSMGWDIRNGTYGLFNLPSIGMAIVPLRYR